MRRVLICLFSLHLFSCPGDDDDDEVEIITPTDEGCGDSDAFTSGSGPGEIDAVLVCPGEDWGVPEVSALSGANDNPYGTVYCGYGTPVGGSANESCTGQAWGGNYWISHADSAEADIDIDSALSNYASATFDKRIYIPIFDGICGGHSPEWLNTEDGIPLMSEILAGGYTDPVFGRDLTEDVSTSTLETWRDLWDSSYAYAYPFWNEEYLARRRQWIETWRDYLVDNSDADIVAMLQINGECGLEESYLRYGMLSADELDVANEALIEAGLRDGDGNLMFQHSLASVAPRWLVGIGNGGRAYLRSATVAAANGLGLGNHGSTHLNTYRFLQLFEHIEYDSTYETYRPTGSNPYAFLHTDLEVFGSPNTYGDYRVFRFLAASAIALGFDSLLVSAFTIPSEDQFCDSNPTKCDDDTTSETRHANFDWSQIEDEGAADFLEWMNIVVGQPAYDTPEAFCLLAQTGVALPDVDGFDFDTAIAEKHEQSDWGEIDGWESYLSVPIVTHRGRHCLHDRTIEGGASEPALQMTVERLLGETFTDVTSRNWGDNQSLDSDGEPEVFFYEGRAPTDDNPTLYFTLDDEFGEGGYSIKVIFEYPETGDAVVELQYESAEGWISGPRVDLSDASNGIHTMTFRVEDARFGDSGPSGADLALHSVGSGHPAFLAVRVLRL